jgi:hypothetical protein
MGSEYLGLFGGFFPGMGVLVIPFDDCLTWVPI